MFDLDPQEVGPRLEGCCCHQKRIDETMGSHSRL